MSNSSFNAHSIKNELAIFEQKYSESISSNNPRIQEIIDYMKQSSGKLIRPTLLLLAARYNAPINEVSYYAAITVELLHNATLIHDDVVDESLVRRGRPSCNAIYDNKVAVLAGDFYLSTSLVTSVSTYNFEIISLISQLGRTLAEGELNQLALVRNIIIDEEEYYDVIRKKTASLISSCMKIGAISTESSTEVVTLFEKLGDSLGMIFQLRDDIFDYFKQEVGKPTGNDLREGKITLPLIYALKNSDDIYYKSKGYDIIDKFDFTDDNIQFLIDFTINNGGIDYAYKVMEDFREKSLELISQLHDCPVKQNLLELLEYLIKRKY